jgi:hypothetical protein
MSAQAQPALLAPKEKEWLAQGHEIFSVQADAELLSKSGVVQGEEDAPKAVNLSAERKRIYQEVEKLPTNYGGANKFFARLADIQADIDSGGNAEALASELSKIEGQIRKVLTAKPPSQSEKEAHQTWVKDIYTPKEQQFAKECSATAAKLLEAGRKRAGDASLNLKFISDKVLATRHAFEQELMLEGSGDGVAILKQFQDRLAAVEKEQTSFINSEAFAKLAGAEADAGKAHAEQVKQNAAQDELNTALLAARKVLAKLDDLGNAAAAGFRKELETAKDKGKIAEIQGRIETAITEHKDKSDAAAKAHGEAADKVAANVDKIAKNLSADAKKSLLTLKEELERTKALAETGNEAAAKAAKDLSDRIDGLVTAAADKNSAFNKLFEGVKAQQEVLDDADIKKYFAEEQKELSGVLTKASAAVDPLELPAAEKELAGLTAKISALKSKSENLTVWRQKTENDLRVLNKILDEFRNTVKDRNNVVTQTLGGLFDKLVAADTRISLLMTEIKDGYQKPGVDTGKMDALRVDLKERVAKLEPIWRRAYEYEETGALKGALDQEAAEGKAELDRRKQEEAKKEAERKAWEKEYEAFNAKVVVLKAAVAKNKGPEDEVATITGLAEAGNKMAKAGDVAGARDKLKLAEKRRADLAKFPGGVTMRSADELEKVPEKWGEAIQTLRAKLEELNKAIDDEAGLTSESRSAAKAKVDKTLELFSLGAFNEAVFAVTKGTTVEAKKQAREKILKQVRQYRSLMDANPVLQLVRRNPFGVKQVTKLIKDCLASIELNSLRAIKADEGAGK